MSLKQQLQDDLKQAMRAKDELALSVLRMALAAVSNEEIRLGSKGEGLADQDVVSVLKKQVKQRNDAIELYQKAGDQARTVQEEQEKKALEKYLPAQASAVDIEAVVNEVLAVHPGATQKDFGALMKEVVAQFGGNADGKAVSETLRRKMNS